jgi:MoxR-like ATPase
VNITSFRPKAAADASGRVEAIVAAASEIVLGKTQVLRLAVTCLLAGGHLLLEDLPGVGKTTLAQALARLLGLSYQRLQCTSDLLPADVLGVSVYDRNDGQFHFHPGPVFTQVLLADEINRATPRAQSSLLEAMEERQVTLEGRTMPLPSPFFVIATQNPTDQVGTYPLPESQLDRFLMRIEIGFPTAEAEREIMRGVDRRTQMRTLQPLLSVHELAMIRTEVEAVHASDALIDYVYRLVQHSRQGDFGFGLSPRGSLALLRASKAWALLHGRRHALPEDVQAVLGPVAEHRLRGTAETGAREGETLARRLLAHVDVIN